MLVQNVFVFFKLILLFVRHRQYLSQELIDFGELLLGQLVLVAADEASLLQKHLDYLSRDHFLVQIALQQGHYLPDAGQRLLPFGHLIVQIIEYNSRTGATFLLSEGRFLFDLHCVRGCGFLSRRGNWLHCDQKVGEEDLLADVSELSEKVPKQVVV